MSDQSGLPDSVSDENGSAPIAVDAADSVSQERHKRRVFTIFVLLMLAAAVILFCLYWFHWRKYETTDDAFIDAHISTISSQIAGRVVNILVEDNQYVHAGEVLLEVDPRDYHNALDRALAARNVTAAQTRQIESQIHALKATFSQAQSNVALAEAEYERDSQDYRRYQDSVPAVSSSELSVKLAAKKTSAAKLESEKQLIQHTLAMIAKEESSLIENAAALAQADVEIENARLQLSYTQVQAPRDGYVAQRRVEQGNYVNAGANLLSVVSDSVWVTANFKEIQLRDMRPGQAVEVQIDAYPRQRFSARVDSLQRGTGSVFSLLPSENATGNYVKIVQRLPVKIVFTDDRISDFLLAPGMSVVPYVHVR